MKLRLSPRMTSHVAASLSYVLILLLCTPFFVVSPQTAKANSRTADASRPAARHRASELLLKFKSGVSQQTKDLTLLTHGARRKKNLRGNSRVEQLEILGAQDPQTLALQLMLDPAVEFAEPNYVISKDEIVPDDPSFSEQWALRNTGQDQGTYGSDIEVAEGWSATTGSLSTIVAVIDSGIDFTHPDLINNQWTNPTPSADGDLHGWDYVADNGPSSTNRVTEPQSQESLPLRETTASASQV